MRINPNLFINGRFRLGSGYPTDVKWHPLYAEDEGYHFIAASYNTGEIKLFEVIEKNGGGKVELKHEMNYVADNYSACLCLDWSPDGHYIVAGYRDGTLRLFDTYTDKMVNSFNSNKLIHKKFAYINFSLDGRFIVFIFEYEDSLRYWDTSDCKEVSDFDCSAIIRNTSFGKFNPQGQIVSYSDGIITLLIDMKGE